MSDYTENIDLPNNWVLCTFQDVSEGENAIVDGPFGSNLKTSDYIDDSINGVPVLTTKNLEGDYSDEKVRFISKEKFEELKRSQVNPGDIVVAKIGSIGKNGIYPKNGRTAIIPANLLKFTVSKKVAFNYVYQYLNFFGLQNKIKDIATATAQPAFNVTKFRLLEIPLPPLPEQHRIVAKIEELFSSLDKGIESLKTAQEQLKVYRQAVLKWAFEGRLTNKDVKEGELPEGWEWKKISEISNVVRGGSPRPAGDPRYYNGNIPFLKVADLTKDNKVYLTTFEYTIKEAGLHKTRQIEPDTLLLTNSGATLGVPKICKIKATMNDGIAAFLDLDKRSLYYLYYFWVSKTRELRTINQGAAQPNLNTEIIKNYEVAFPPTFEEQNLIVQEIESRLSVCDKIEESISTSLQQAEALRQSILKKAFEGKLAEQDPNDEPASVLLERIKEEREKIKPVKKVKTKMQKIANG